MDGVGYSQPVEYEGWVSWSWHEQALALRELKPYLVASVILLAAGALYGVATSAAAPAAADASMEALREFGGLFLGLSKIHLALAIFLNNAIKSLLVIVLGVFGGLLPLIFLLINGYVIGLVLHFTAGSEGGWTTVLAIVPHGIFELPAILLGTSIGLMLGVQAVKRLLGRKDIAVTAELARGIRFFLVVIVPLLLLSAFIEAFISAAAVSR
jgi:stage II sporulation protein M